MRSMRKIVLMLLIAMLVIPSFFVTASTNEEETKMLRAAGESKTKEEVVYAILNASGEKEEMYVVNAIDVIKEGEIVDYGSYSSLKNLTDLSEIKGSGDQVQFTAPEGTFYYQGNLEDKNLPWEFSIRYLLNGESVLPEDLAGEDGQLEIQIETAENEAGQSLFFENYLLQITIHFNSEKVKNIQAEDGMIANVGKNQQVTFTVMPEQEEQFFVRAEITDFELDGIDIAAIPSTMPIDEPDLDEMKDNMGSLSEAITKINNGVGELHDGVTELNNGVATLRDGSATYDAGISSLARSSPQLIHASSEINLALKEISSALGSTEAVDFSSLTELAGGLSELSSGLKEIATGLSTLKSTYETAYGTLDGAMQAIPVATITDSEIQALYESGANVEVVEKFVETYTASQIAKGTYEQVKQAFNAVGDTLGTVSTSLNELATEVDGIIKGFASIDNIDGLEQLQSGLELLATNYKDFHAGLVDYTDGINMLATSYGDLHGGISDLSVGTNELVSGVADLHDGTSTLQQSTSNLPEEMTEEIDKMIAEYDKSDFDPVSFVSEKNKNVQSVQFILKTESIKKPEKELDEEQVEEEKGFWARLKALFFK